MTGSLYLLGTLAFVLVSLVIGVRLVALSRRTGERPELYLGLGILGTAVLGYGMQIASVMARGGPAGTTVTPLIVGLTFFGRLLHDAGLTLILVFVLTVFHPGKMGPRIGVGLALVCMWVGMCGVGLSGGFQDLLQRNTFWWMEFAVIWTYPLWGAWESFRYHGRMRRRGKLGLADPLVTNRFLLWGIASLGTFMATWLASWPMLLSDPAVMRSLETLNYMATAVVGSATVTAYSLAFLPPAWYRRWLSETGPAGEAQAA